MSTISRRLCAGFFLTTICGAAAAAPPPVEAFGSLPAFSSARLSPDGKHLAVVQPHNKESAIAIYDVADLSKPPHMVAVPDAVAAGIDWPNNDRVICTFRLNQKEVYYKYINEWARSVSVDVNGRNEAVLLNNWKKLKYNTGSAIVEQPPEDPNHVYMLAYDTPDTHDEQDLWNWHLGLFKVDVTTGEGVEIMLAPKGAFQILMDGHGHPLGFVKHNADLSSEVVMGGRIAGTFNSKGGVGPEFVGLSNDPTPSLLVEAPGPTGITGLYHWAASGAVSTALFADQQYDVDDTIEDEQTGRIIGVTYADDRSRVRYFNPAMQAIQTTLEKALPNQTVRIVSKDAAGTSYLVDAEGPRNPPTLFLYTPATHQLMQLLQAYPGLQQSDLGEMKPYPYTARDGLDIHAYLTLPPGKDPHNLPTIIMPHGGPEARDMLRFDWLAQFLASRGYAVLQPNFRGSSGYGWRFVTAGDGEWANKVQFDVQDGVKKLIAEGVSDPKRTCIFGWSYGGYMSLAGATFSPDLYACAAAMAGVYDLDKLNYSGTKFESMDTSVWERRMGVSSMDSAAMEAQSPSEHAERVKIPILLMHSEKDVTVPIEQSEIEERALKRADKSVQFIRINGDDHYLSYAPTRIQMLTELEKFMAANIGH